MGEKIKKGKESKEEYYVCGDCKSKYDLTEARIREMTCCSKHLLKTEVITKSDPTPFGP